MVKNCSLSEYPIEQETKYKEEFSKYPFELSIFQKYAIEAIREEQHVLVTAHTGTGKTLPAEHAIEYFVSKGKKVIYTGPIKTLINQKFYDFTNKFPHISFGVLTGDIKFNPEADVLVMTAEILLNKLYQLKNKETSRNKIDFDIDFDNELACVVMDEVHYINDADRGHVWENTIMMLPPHIQLVMLSATIDQPEKFASWCENLHKNKQVYLTNTTHRVVPLTHYSFITTTQSIFKHIKDKTIQAEIKSVIDKPLIVQSSNGKFQDDTYAKIHKVLKLIQTNNVVVKRPHVLNKVTHYLVEHEMLPALCFVLSRKQLEICANEVTTNLLEFDSKVPYIIDRECEDILRSKLKNVQEYLHLPEYIHMVSLLRKGIAIHHSGVLPVLKEIVELLYAKGYIKLLFATETFSVGVNMPTKTVIFTDVTKYDGSNVRTLYGHEYSQMSGRAGRRGIDTVGSCIHLHNLFRNTDIVSYKSMLCGKPQTLTSKFKISYHWLLNLLDGGHQHFTEFAGRSMITEDLDNEMKDIYSAICKLKADIERTPPLQTPDDILDEYNDLSISAKHTVNKKRKEIERRISIIVDEHNNIIQDIERYQDISIKKKQITELQSKYNILNRYFQSRIENVVDILKPTFVQHDNNTMTLTTRGKIASQLRELHCLVFAKLYDLHKLDHLTAKELISLFSCFTNIVVSDDVKDIHPSSPNTAFNQMIKETVQLHQEYQDKESYNNIDVGFEYNSIHYDLLHYLDDWCDAGSIDDCKQVLQRMVAEKDIFLGEFVKALLKINNIAAEFEKIAEMTGNILFLHKLKDIPTMTLKYVVTNQSLYV